MRKANELYLPLFLRWILKSDCHLRKFKEISLLENVDNNPEFTFLGSTAQSIWQHCSKDRNRQMKYKEMEVKGANNNFK